jgi:hypothetical protein
MDILQSLTREHSKKQTDRIVAFIGADKGRFAVLIKLFFAGEYRITQRAAWPLSYCVRAPIAVKAFSLTILSHLAADYPDIRGELKLIIEEQWEHSTAAFRSRAKKVLKQMETATVSSSRDR